MPHILGAFWASEYSEGQTTKACDSPGIGQFIVWRVATWLRSFRQAAELLLLAVAHCVGGGVLPGATVGHFQ